jgi:hygromycin-B 7''-O-kinase
MSTPPPTLLPQADTLTTVSNIRKNQPLFEPGLRHILRLSGLPADATISGTIGGSMAVFGVNDDLIVKLFSPLHRAYFENELASLRLLAGKTTFDLPQIKASGTLETWSYLVMTRVRGTQLFPVWRDLPDAKKITVCENLGATLAALHRIPIATDADAPKWRAFIAGQAERCVEHQRARGVSESLLAQIPAYIAPALAHIAASPVVFLHTELMLEHIFIDPDRLTIAGLIDFEPSMIGPAEYDFGAVPIFVSETHPHLLRAFIRSYGYPWKPATPRLLMTYLLLHRYSNLVWFLERLGPDRAKTLTTLEDLEKTWFSIEP